MNRRTLFAALLLALPLPVYAQTPAAPAPTQATRPAKTFEKVFNAEHFTLANGLEIVVIPNHRAPVVTQMVWYRVGAGDEKAGHSGLAHFLEHLMFKGSEGLAPGEFSRTIRSLGGNDNAFTGQDYTAYYQSVAKENLEKVMTMEAGRMRGLNVPADAWESERQVILEERRQRTDNDPRAQFSEQMNAALFVNNRYGSPVIGWMHEIEKVTWPEAKAFYDLWYAPNNAILVVSGDVTGEEVKALAEKTYGKIERREVPARDRLISPPLYSHVRVSLHHDAIQEPMVQQAYRVPGYRQNHEDSLALQVLDEIAGGGPTSRFYKSLVIDQKIAIQAGISYDGDVWDDGTFWAYATPAPGVALEKVQAALEAELRKLVESGVTDTELAEAKTRMQAAAIYARDDLEGPAMVFGHALATGSSVDDVEQWPAKIEGVTAAQIQDVVKRFLNPDADQKNPVVTGFLLPPEKEEPAAMPEETPAQAPVQTEIEQ